MYEPGAVDRGERGGDADGQPFQVAGTQRAAGEHGMGQRQPVDVLGDQVGRAIRRVDDLEHLRGAEPGDPAGHVGLAQEPLPELRQPGQVGPNHLDRDQAQVALDAIRPDLRRPAGRRPGRCGVSSRGVAGSGVAGGRAAVTEGADAQVDGSHPALAEPADQLVATQLLGVVGGKRVGGDGAQRMRRVGREGESVVRADRQRLLAGQARGHEREGERLVLVVPHRPPPT